MRWRFLLFAVALVPLSTYAWATQARPLVIGSISNDPATEIAVWSPFASFLAGQLSGMGISEGRIIVAQNQVQMAGMLRHGDVDLYIDSPLISTLVGISAGSKPLLRRWKRGHATYASVIFVRADSGLATIGDLKGHSIAFQSAFSTTGYHLPRLALRQANLVPVPLARVGSAIPEENVAYGFSNNDENTRAWVLQGRVHAGATGSGDFERWKATDRLKVIWRSTEIPRQIVSYRRDLKAALVSEITKSLLSMHTSEEGRAVLRNFEETARFDEIPPEQLAFLRRISRDAKVFAPDMQ